MVTIEGRGVGDARPLPVLFPSGLDLLRDLKQETKCFLVVGISVIKQSESRLSGSSALAADAMMLR